MAQALAPVAEPELVFGPRENHRAAWTVASSLSLMALDVVSVLAAFALSYHLRFETNLLPILSITPWSLYALMGWLCALTLVVTFFIRDLYLVKRGVSTVEYVWRLIGATTLSYIIAVALTTLILKFDYPRAATAMAWLATVLFLVVERLTVRRLLYALRR